MLEIYLHISIELLLFIDSFQTVRASSARGKPRRFAPTESLSASSSSFA